jgi:aryl-alcohol dehydrogenase-like predicted oxidoreductase
MLTGKMTRGTTFATDDHRSYNREGRSFDQGETFSGVDFETGLEAVEELRPLVPAGATMAQMALRWILMFDAVTCTIPGARRPAQAEDNISAVDLPPLSDFAMEEIRAIYDRHIRAQVHHLW